MIRKFLNAGKINQKSIWETLDEYASKAETPVAMAGLTPLLHLANRDRVDKGMRIINYPPVPYKTPEYKRSYKQGGQFTFKKSLLVKNAEKLHGKRDMRKKLVKSDIITNKKKRISKGLEGLKFVSYTPIETPILNNIEITNPFSEYNFPSTYQKYITLPADIEEVPTDIEPVEPTKKPTLTAKIINHIYKDRNTWVKDLKEAYKKAGITNENALRMLIAQDALESGWGKSAQGRFNYGNLTPGKSWKGDIVSGKDKDGKGNPISLKFRSYNSMEEYAADKVLFLKTLYDFNENDDINTFVHKLLGNNKGKRKYATSPSYILSILKMYNNSKLQWQL